jgi:hypothetical protein
MFLKANKIVRRAFYERGIRYSDERKIAMKPDKEDPVWTKRSATTREELKIVCEKIADVDALWRMNPLQESPTEKRAA